MKFLDHRYQIAKVLRCLSALLKVEIIFMISGLKERIRQMVGLASSTQPLKVAMLKKQKSNKPSETLMKEHSTKNIMRSSSTTQESSTTTSHEKNPYSDPQMMAHYFMWAWTSTSIQCLRYWQSAMAQHLKSWTKS